MSTAGIRSVQDVLATMRGAGASRPAASEAILRAIDPAPASRFASVEALAAAIG